MKHCKSTFIALLLLVNLAANAQINRFDIGIEGGPSSTSIRGNDVIYTHREPAIGFSGGVFCQLNFKKIISLRAAIAYERKGSQLTGKATDQYGNATRDFSYHFNFDYLTLPVLARATFGKKIHYFVNAGPYFGYLLKQTSIANGIDIPEITTDGTSTFKRLDMGLSTGLGVSVPIGDEFAVSLEVRNNLGLYNISKLQVIDDGSIKTNSTNILFGLAYKL